MFLDALHVSYDATEVKQGETEYLLSSDAMKAHLNRAAEQEKNGEGVRIRLEK
jgi:hypothetical protein